MPRPFESLLRLRSYYTVCVKQVHSLLPPSDLVPTAYHLLEVSCYVAAGFAFGVTIVASPRVQCGLGNLHGRVCCYVTRLPNPPSGLLVSILLLPLHPTHSHLGIFIEWLTADCFEFDTSVVLIDFSCTTSTRWYVLLIECQVSFCMAPFEDEIPRRLTNLCSFARHVRVRVVLC